MTHAQVLYRCTELSEKGGELPSWEGEWELYWKGNELQKGHGEKLFHAEEATAIKTLTANCDNGELKMFKMKLQLDKATLLQVHKKEKLIINTGPQGRKMPHG